MKKQMFSLFAVCLATIGSARTITVTTVADAYPTGPEGSLRAALAEATDGDIITFDSNIASETITVVAVDEKNADTSFLVNHAVTIKGPEGGITIASKWTGDINTADSRDYGARLFLVQGNVGQAVFDGIRFYHGNARQWGNHGGGKYSGGACGVEGPAKFQNCTFDTCAFTTGASSSNYNHGGGAICANADLEISNCVFTNCAVGDCNGFVGGAVYISSPDANTAVHLTIEDTDFLDCFSYRNGGALGVENNVASVSVKRTRFLRCYQDKGTGVYGGAVYVNNVQAGTPVLFEDCAFRENKLFLRTSDGNGGEHGGAIYAKHGRLILNRCEFYGNRARACGGAIAVRDGNSTVTAVNCTFNYNACGSHGGAADVRTGSYFVNCTFAGNRVWKVGDSTESASAYISGTCMMLNCCSVYCPNVNGWINKKATLNQMDTDRYVGFNGNPTKVNCLWGNDYIPVTKLGDESNVETASKLFTDYAYWESPMIRAYGDTEGVTLPNTTVVYPLITDNSKNPNQPRVVSIVKDGLLDGTGYLVKANADFSYIAYLADKGATWTDFYGTDDGTAQLITADQRGIAYYNGKTPIGAATYAESSPITGLLIIVR